MKLGLFLLVLYGVDFAVDSSFGNCAWAQEWGNTLSISEASQAPQHPQLLDSPSPSSKPSQIHDYVPFSPASPPRHYGAELVYSIQTIRC
jgi:hypothetical protein